MSLSHTWTTSIKCPGLPTLPSEAPVVVVGNDDQSFEFDVPANSVGHVTFGSIDKTKIISLVLNSTNPGDAHTNAADGSGGQGPIPLVKGKSFCWNNQMDATAFPNPITANITSIYFDNSANNSIATVRASFIIAL